MLEFEVLTLALVVASSAPPDTRYDREIAAAIEDVHDVHYVPAALVKAVIMRESSWNPRAVSRAGALGLMQLLPATAAKVGVSREELFDPAKNILGGVRLLAVLLRHYRGDVISALTAYNARPRELFAPIPQNGETPGYVRAVLESYARYAGGKLHVVPEDARGAR
ncbi:MULTISPECIES: lytic transglycosylase domain-containing protein [Anaeromyxobacter]|uniref:lytic transglycosylase domain-containing protein n=1 Tax=Anaeromyxobacter TaxID=161492 RepID=UPI001F5ADC56|nr:MULTISPECIES: lytic transglycosylase domain-containing protein [unclassified Anaeromyxobacter]